VVRSNRFSRRPAWTVDILIEDAGDGRPLVIEYDGAYWHSAAAKEAVDMAKTRDLLAAGYRVVRLRETPLEGLGIEDPGYLELPVVSALPQPAATVSKVRDWLRPR
jgi:hypothetical protein